MASPTQCEHLHAEARPYTEAEFHQTYRWLVGWGLVHPDATYAELVDSRIEVAG